jgi:transaldolase
MMTKLHELARLGQSIWYDNLSRALLDSGGIQGLIDQGVRGITSNPTIFEKAITGGTAYDDAIRALGAQGYSAQAIYEVLVVEDIRRAADLLRPLYTRTQGADGYVSLEVSPGLAHQTAATVNEARRLFTLLQRPNVMIKVPATPAGIPAVETLIAEGININITLIFSLAHYEAVARAHVSGLEQFCAARGDPAGVASVASFFVSRIDTAVDQALAAADNAALAGRTAIANAQVAYARRQEIYATTRWQALARRGARPQRLLWASTGTKNRAYPDTLYVDALIGRETVNTVPPATLEAFMDHGTVAATLTADAVQAEQFLERLAQAGVDLAVITQTLQTEGVEAFAASYASLLAGLKEKARSLKAAGGTG